jgi:HD-GYP domain-containing protein (c-di-GMP phosphodiesterase class II)
MEDRPYRKGMTQEEVFFVLKKMAREASLDMNIVSLLVQHFDDIDALRITAQAETAINYKIFSSSAPADT